MQTKQHRKFTPDQESIIDHWAKTYPYRKSIGMALIKSNPEENAKLQQLVASGFTELDVYRKGYYHRMHVIGDVPLKSSYGKKYEYDKPHSKARVNGGYQCQECGERFSKYQTMAAHMQWQHKRGARANKVAKAEKAKIMNGARNDEVTVNVPNELVGRFIFVTRDGEVKPVRLLKCCPECTLPLTALNAAMNITV